MRLIETAGFVDGVENGGALLQEVRSVSRAFDLTDRAVGQTRRSRKMALSGSEGQGLPFTAYCRIHGGVTRDDTFLHKSLHECLRILEVGIFPRRAIQPERATRRVAGLRQA